MPEDCKVDFGQLLNCRLVVILIARLTVFERAAVLTPHKLALVGPQMAPCFMSLLLLLLLNF